MEHMGRELHTDTGYLQRNAANVLRTAFYYNIYPNQKKLPWLKTITLFGMCDITHDLNTQEDDIYFATSLNFYLIK